LPYQVDLTPRAKRDLAKLPSPVARTAAERLHALGNEPRPRQATKLRAGPPRWRLRFGRYRIIYAISDRERLVMVLRILLRTEGTYD